jgi:hypothetical protein
MPDDRSSMFSRGHDRWLSRCKTDVSVDTDAVMEQILENLHQTPLGQVLKNIAALPEIRRDKVLKVRRQIDEGRYDLAERLDLALERVLEDLTT